MPSPFVYDAPAILGLGPASSDPLPEPGPGEITIRVGEWSPRDIPGCPNYFPSYQVWEGPLMNIPAVQCENTQLGHGKLTPGVYCVRLPIPRTNYRHFPHAQRFLLPNEQVLPFALGAAVLLCHQQQTGKELTCNWMRCAEQFPDGTRVTLYTRRSQVRYGGCRDREYNNGWIYLAGYRMC